ncbi:hypothetical protein ANN_00738 [Periplaneta americana]|uniref:PiggyBac transposable element-derived protein domain-containing protein n=1 Tax=Periplaneta americana TaxID=6978 RepID=A0ABQ8TVM7_PERAM|nr:hypothetical protein ANN_00738 [Periplaneta americana]
MMQSVEDLVYFKRIKVAMKPCKKRRKGLGPSQILDLIDEGDRSDLEEFESEGGEKRDDELFEANKVSEKDDGVENKSSADNAEPTEENGADDADPREDNGAESGADAENDQQPDNELLAEDEYEWMNLTSKDKIQWQRSVIFQETIPIWEDNNGGEDILDLPITHFSRYIPISMFEKLVEMTNIYAKQLGECVGETDKVRRWDNKNKKYIDVSRPKVVKLYNQSMGGVDKLDFLISLYRIFMKTRNWTLKLIFHAVDLAVCNNWLEYQADAEKLGIYKNKTLDLLHFRMRVGEALVKQEKEIPTKRGRPSNIDPKESQTTKILKSQANP